ncbi:PEP-CTERM sorting domain-containing protein [Planctomycetales bacterium ZRK34]|nr:PEP-CTERM sorting domain-containing protein [Planctomycetales bacterium ZRK34]
MHRIPAFMIALALAASSLTHAATVTTMVDINGGDGPTQAGWLAFDPTGPSTFTDALGAGRDLTVEITQNGALRDRDRGTTVTGTYAELSNLLRDFYGSRSNNDIVTLTLTLDAGAYHFLSYHHDAEAGSTNTQEVEFTRIGSGVIQTDVIHSSDAPTDIVTFEDTFTLASATSVQFQIQKTALASNNGEFGFNGFELTLIPEPTTAAMLVMGGLLVMRRRRGLVQ